MANNAQAAAPTPEHLLAASNSTTNFLRKESDPVRNFMGSTAADRARPGYAWFNPLTKAQGTVLIPKRLQSKPMRGFGVPDRRGIVKNISVKHPGRIGLGGPGHGGGYGVVVRA